jgi:hypothetical protein
MHPKKNKINLYIFIFQIFTDVDKIKSIATLLAITILIYANY